MEACALRTGEPGPRGLLSAPWSHTFLAVSTYSLLGPSRAMKSGFFPRPEWFCCNRSPSGYPDLLIACTPKGTFSGHTSFCPPEILDTSIAPSCGNVPFPGCSRATLLCFSSFHRTCMSRDVGVPSLLGPLSFGPRCSLNSPDPRATPRTLSV